MGHSAALSQFFLLLTCSHRYFSVKQAYEEGLIDKLVPGYSLNRFRKLRSEILGEGEKFFDKEKPKFRFKRDEAAPQGA